LAESGARALEELVRSSNFKTKQSRFMEGAR